MSGLTIIKNPDTQKAINYRPAPFNRLNINVGERPIVGIPYLRSRNFKPIDSRISNTARLGQTSSLPDRRMGQQQGEGLLGDIAKGMKKIGKTIKKKKIISKASKILGDVTSAVAPIALASGHPEIATLAGTTAGISKPVGKLFKSIGLGLKKDDIMLGGVVAGPRGIDKQIFVATHPANYKKIKIEDLQ